MQYNDADGLWWVVVYTSAAVVPLTQMFLSQDHEALCTAAFGLALGCGLLALILTLPKTNIGWGAVKQSVEAPMAAATPFIEGNRELFGSLIAITATITFRYLSTAKRQQ